MVAAQRWGARGGGGQLALLADRDQPVRACGAEIVDAEVAGIGEQHPDPGGWRGGGPVRVDQGCRCDGFAHHLGECGGVAGVVSD